MRADADSLVAWLAVVMLPGLGPIAQRKLLDLFGDPESIAFRVPAHDLAAHLDSPGLAEAIVAARRDLASRARRELRECRRMGVDLVVQADPRYPAALRVIHDPPLLLYSRGDLPHDVVRIAVVGARAASAYGRRVATALGSGLALRGVEVVSGGARGIDTCAHLGALEGGGRTTAVLGSGFARPYPRENEDLFERIVRCGCVLSELPLDAPPKPAHFPQRNRLISGLSAAVVIVEAADRSGSLVTARHASDQGREVMAVPGPVTSDLSAGCHRLIQDGAKLVHEVNDIVAELSPMYAGAVRSVARPSEPRSAPLQLDPDQTALLAILDDDPEPLHLDALAERAPFGIARLQTALFGLELRGAVESLPGGYYACTERARSRPGALT